MRYEKYCYGNTCYNIRVVSTGLSTNRGKLNMDNLNIVEPISKLEQLTNQRNLLLHDRALLIADRAKVDTKLVTQNEKIADIVAEIVLIEADNLEGERSL